MKKTTYNMPNLAGLFAIIALALVVTGCGAAVEKTTTTPMDSTTQTETTATEAPETNNTSPTTTGSVTASSTSEETTKPATSVYKDGTYNVVGDYNSPAGAETIGVSVTLKNDVITDSTVTPEATHPKSVYMQSQFIAGFKPQVIGKKIADVKLGKISGSSLTPLGFNEALAEIQTLAKM